MFFIYLIVKCFVLCYVILMMLIVGMVVVGGFGLFDFSCFYIMFV